MKRVVLLLSILLTVGMLSCDLNQPVVPKTGMIYGYVIDAVSGDSLSEVLIYSSTGEYSATSDAYGQYSLDMDAGVYYLYSSGTGYAHDRDTVTVMRDGYTRHDFLLYSETNGAARVYGDVYSNDADTLITDVNIVAETVPGYIGSTNEAGHFEFYLPPGSQKVTFLHSEYLTISRDLELEISDNEFVRVWMEPVALDTTSGN